MVNLLFFPRIISELLLTSAKEAKVKKAYISGILLIMLVIL